jgi:hypothetical protein
MGIAPLRGGGSDASPAKAWAGVAPRSSSGPPRLGGGTRVASWKLGNGGYSRER